MKYEELVRGMENNEYGLSYPESSIIRQLVRAPQADKHNKPAHYFWHYVAIIIFYSGFPLFFFSFYMAFGALIFGYILHRAAIKSDREFIFMNIKQDKEFAKLALDNGVNVGDQNRSKLEVEF